MDRPPEQAPATAAAHAGAGEAGEAAGEDPGRRSAGHAGIPHVGGDQECLLCPVCVALQALSAARPEVTAHLFAAGRELTLALKSLLEGSLDTTPHPAADAPGGDQAGRPPEPGADEPAPRLRRITLD